MPPNKMTALLVDDSKLSRNLLKHYVFSEFGDVEILEEANGNDGLKTFLEREPHITFLDLTMPGMNGFEFLKSLTGSNKKGKIAVLSADTQDISRENALALGADYFISKPIKNQLARISSIVNSIRSQLGLKAASLTEWQKNALVKIFSSATSKAAETLSSVIGTTVEISIPSVDLVEHESLDSHLRENFTPDEKLVVLRQPFGGNFQGYAFLIFNEKEAKDLVRTISDIPDADGSEEAERDAMLEIANILMGSCVGAFGNTVEMPLTLYPPVKTEGKISLVDDIPVDKMMMYALVAKGNLVFREKNIQRTLGIVTSISSMKILMEFLDEMLKTKQ